MAYNAALVRRGEILLDFGMMGDWKRELAEMNGGKEGGRYMYPDSFVRLLAFIHVYLRLPYRQLEGFVRMLSRHLDGLRVPDYSSMAWRIQRLDVKLNDDLAESMEEVVLAVDSSGVKGCEPWRVDAPQMECTARLSQDPYRCRCEAEEDLGVEGYQGEGCGWQAPEKPRQRSLQTSEGYEGHRGWRLRLQEELPLPIRERNRSHHQGTEELIHQGERMHAPEACSSRIPPRPRSLEA